MPKIAYTVRATFTDPAVAERFVKWMVEEHLRDLLNAGAERAEAVRLDTESVGPSPVVECRYVFPDRAAYMHYIQKEAPRLRGRGLELFGPKPDGSPVVTYVRSVGEIHPAAN
jgi:hypothetical protein